MHYCARFACIAIRSGSNVHSYVYVFSYFQPFPPLLNSFVLSLSTRLIHSNYFFSRHFPQCYQSIRTHRNIYIHLLHSLWIFCHDEISISTWLADKYTSHVTRARTSSLTHTHKYVKLGHDTFGVHLNNSTALFLWLFSRYSLITFFGEFLFQINAAAAIIPVSLAINCLANDIYMHDIIYVKLIKTDRICGVGDR